LRQPGFGVDYHVDTVFSLGKSFRYAQSTYETPIAGEKTVEALASINSQQGPLFPRLKLDGL